MLNLSRIKNKLLVLGQRVRFGNVGKNLKLIFVTGTYGKSTVADVARHLLSGSGLAVGAITTTGLWFKETCVDEHLAANVLTAPLLYSSLRRLHKMGAELVILEANFRTTNSQVFNGLEFEAGVLTNLYDPAMVELPKELSFDAYCMTLFSLVSQIEPEGLVVVPGDDPQVEEIKAWAAAVPQPVYAAWYKRDDLKNVNLLLSGSSFEAQGAFLHTKLLGNFNLANTMQAILLCQKYMGMDEIDKALAEYLPIPGRWQLVSRQGISLLIDYAYHPRLVALNVGELLQQKGPGGRLIMLAGAAGERNGGRANLLGRVVKDLDYALLAALDPRSEKVSSLNKQIAKRAEAAGAVLVEEIDAHDEYLKMDKHNLLNKLERVRQNSDLPVVAFNEQGPGGRMDAIEFALWLARPGDILYLQGKGGDKVLDFGTVVYEWDEVKVIDQFRRQE